MRNVHRGQREPVLGGVPAVADEGILRGNRRRGQKNESENKIRCQIPNWYESYHATGYTRICREMYST